MLVGQIIIMAGLKQRNQIKRLQRRESAGSGRKKLKMKCPFRTIVNHTDAYSYGYRYHPAQTITEFAECYKEQCPCYDKGNCMRIKQNEKVKEENV